MACFMGVNIKEKENRTSKIFSLLTASNLVITVEIMYSLFV
jgi:hypothetical protein